MSLMRCTGRVVKVEDRSGVKNDTPWAFTLYRVLVAEQDVAELTAFSNSAHTFSVGDEIDVAVNAEVRGGRLSLNIDQPWELLAPATPASSTRKVRAAS